MNPRTITDEKLQELLSNGYRYAVPADFHKSDFVRAFSFKPKCLLVSYHWFCSFCFEGLKLWHTKSPNDFFPLTFEFMVDGDLGASKVLDAAIQQVINTYAPITEIEIQNDEGVPLSYLIQKRWVANIP